MINLIHENNTDQEILLPLVALQASEKRGIVLDNSDDFMPSCGIADVEFMGTLANSIELRNNDFYIIPKYQIKPTDQWYDVYEETLKTVGFNVYAGEALRIAFEPEGIVLSHIDRKDFAKMIIEAGKD